MTFKYVSQLYDGTYMYLLELCDILYLTDSCAIGKKKPAIKKTKKKKKNTHF